MIWGRGKPPNAKENRRSSRRSVGIVRIHYRAIAIVLTIALLFCSESYAAQQVLEWVDDLSCSYRIKFDPRKYDEGRLRNTAEFVLSQRIFSFPIPQAHLRLGDSGVNAYRAVCARSADRLASFPLIELPGIEAYRGLKLGQLQEWCDFGVALIRGSSGDIAALRAFAPSAGHCSRYLDGLDGRSDIRQVWRELVFSRCQKFANPGACRTSQFAVESRPDALEQIRDEVLTYGWQNCSTRYLKTGNSVRQTAASMEAGLEAAFRKRFQIMKAPCAD